MKENKPLPRSIDIDFDKGWQREAISEAHLIEVGRRWRLQSRQEPKKDDTKPKGPS